MNNISSNKSRRVVLKKAVTIGALAASVKEIPSGWSKPVIDTILLPAHAQTSAVASSCECTSVPSSGASVTEDQEIRATFRVVPNPGTPVLIRFTATCDGGLSESGVFERETNADGIIELTATPSGEKCSVGSTMGLEADCAQSGVERCEWLVIEKSANVDSGDSENGGNLGKAWSS